MTNDEFFDIGRVAYITGNVQEALAAKQALETVVENANSLQQLKAEIAQVAANMETHCRKERITCMVTFINKLVQLSAV